MYIRYAYKNQLMKVKLYKLTVCVPQSRQTYSSCCMLACALISFYIPINNNKNNKSIFLIFIIQAEKFLTASQMRLIDSSSAPSKMVCNLMNAIFTTNEMRICIVSGNRQKEGGDGANAKQVLDQEKVQFVVGMYYVFYVDIFQTFF